jgi:hypothetical protein
MLLAVACNWMAARLSTGIPSNWMKLMWSSPRASASGVPAGRIYLDEGLTGTTRARPDLDQALAAVRDGDAFAVTKLDRLARSVPDGLEILGQLSDRGVRFELGTSVYDWHDAENDLGRLPPCRAAPRCRVMYRITCASRAVTMNADCPSGRGHTRRCTGEQAQSLIRTQLGAPEAGMRPASDAAGR